MNYDIGILTYWSVPNYGAYAQAYALNKVLSGKKFGNREVKHIAYLNPEHKKLYYDKQRLNLSERSLLNPKTYKYILNCIFENKRRKWTNFQKDFIFIPHTDMFTETNLKKTYFNCIVTGSDAIWEFSIADFGDDEFLIGNHLNCKKLISYATSFGTMHSESKFPIFVSEGLNNYNDIAVRDENSAEIVNMLTGKYPLIVLDPTLLCNFREDNNIPSLKYRKYILVYGCNYDENTIIDIKKYAHSMDLKIISIGCENEWSDINMPNIGPMNWIGMFRNAEIVVTCTFHGLMLGISFRKKILFNQVAYVVNRSNWLLKKLDLYDLMTNRDTCLEKILSYEWDYNKIELTLDKLRAEAICYLKKGIDDCGI